MPTSAHMGRTNSMSAPNMSRIRRVMGGIVAAGHPKIRKNVQGAQQVIDSVGTTCLLGRCATSGMPTSYYHESRLHLSLDRDSPNPRPVQSLGKVIAIPEVGGLHHRYERRAA